jgi:hypothetical protein
MDIHFIFKLIADRLSVFLKQDVNFLRWEELRRAMANEEIRLSENQYLMFQRSLVDSGVYLPQPENKLNRLVLAKVCDYFRDRYLENGSVEEEAGGFSLSGAGGNSSMSSSQSRLVRSLTPNWKFVKSHIQSSVRGGGVMVSEEQLLMAIRVAGGIVITAPDMRDLWAYLVKHSESSGDRSSDRVLPLSEIDALISAKESNYSSFSALMRDEYHPAVVRPYTDNPNKEDHLRSLFKERPNTCTSSPPSKIPSNSVSSFPWQGDEANAVSNVKIRVLAGLKKAGLDKQQAFIQALYHNEKHYRNKVLPRGILLEAFACAGIHLNRHDVQDIWDEAHSTLPSPLRVVDLQTWLQLDHISPPVLASPVTRSGESTPTSRKPTSLADMSYDRHNRRYQAHYAPAWAPPDGSSSSVYDHSGHLSEGRGRGRGDFSQSLGSFHGGRMSQPEPDYASYDVDGGEYQSEMPPAMTMAEAASILLANQPHLAYCFRTLSAGMGLVKGTDLVEVLNAAPFELNMSQGDLWAMVCGMAGTRTDSSKAAVYLRFNDAIRYLEGQMQRSTLPPADSRQRSIVEKLFRSKYVLGSADAMMQQSSILRQRLRYSRQRGPVVTWDGVPDMCSPHEFMSLMNTIDIPLSLDEVEFIYDNVRRQELKDGRSGHGRGEQQEQCMAGQIEHGFSMGAALKYLSELLQLQE